jgi:hypothetical protein
VRLAFYRFRKRAAPFLPTAADFSRIRACTPARKEHSMPYESTSYDFGPGGTVTVLSWVPDLQPHAFELSAPTPVLESVAFTPPAPSLPTSDAQLAALQQDVQDRDAWIAWYREELAQREQSVASLSEQVRILTSELWDQSERLEAIRSPFRPLTIAGRADLHDGLRELPSTAFR